MTLSPRPGKLSRRRGRHNRRHTATVRQGSLEDAVFVLTDEGFCYLMQTFGIDRLLELGVIEPQA